MTTFDDRERGFETKFALDQETEFRLYARRNRLLGLWAGERMGLSGDALEAYVRSVVISDLEHAGHEDVVLKVTSDLGGRTSEAEVRAQLDLMLTAARAEIEAGV